MKEKMLKEITNRINETDALKIFVGIDCAPIHLKNFHELEITGAEETETGIVFDTAEALTFEIGKNYTAVSYDEYENEYKFEYDNGVTITISLL